MLTRFANAVTTAPLSENGARMLKSLTGGDLMEGEIKGQQHRPQMKGCYHVVIVSNNHFGVFAGYLQTAGVQLE